MSMMTVTLVLTGANAGRTCVLRNRKFENGRHQFTADPEVVQSVCTYMGRCYEAFPEGSEELKLAQARDRGEDITDGGDTDASEASESGPTEAVPGDDHEELGSAAAEAADERGVDAGSDGGDSGSGPVGDGHEDSGLSASSAGEEHGAGDNPRLKGVIQDLDPDLDENWTKAGKPALAAVQKAYGADVTRQDINNAAPGWDREKAQEKALADM